jgi:hypothetical protein
VQDGAGRDVEFARGLFVLPEGQRSEKGSRYRQIKINAHLSATEDETLLWRGDTRLLLYFLLDSSDLCGPRISGHRR